MHIDCLIEVTGHKFSKDDLECFEYLESDLVFDEELDGVLTKEWKPPEEDTKKKKSSRRVFTMTEQIRMDHLDAIFLKDCWGMEFKLIRELHDDNNQMSGIEHEVEYCGWRDVAEHYFDDLVKLLEAEINQPKIRLIKGGSLKDTYRSLRRKESPPSKTPVIITAWTYDAGYCSWDGEYDPSWTMLGRVDMNKIQIVEETPNEKPVD